ncbi:hydroxysteroid (20-beta) dehydrogenase 2 [Brienomyrus brachyistius]|uniref:hydroxysteroid (20-beta) dehydrogenase 2 n=1 Tax=Brienomyrus brachyistius TaxID=42636 RepID=UPI0020B3EC97|nr:hydroxysteroid (20-beta) dehydrogenase 2 [Brienomyrus brachyistius]
MDTLLESALVLRALVVIGGFTVLFYCCKFTWKCWRGFRVYVLSEYWRADLRAYGQWAVVTGATSGIGKAYAMELASRGLDVVLVSRSEGKLQAVAKEIERMYGRQTRIIQTDFTEGPQIYPRIAEKLQGLEIGILVNNVGMNYAGMLVSFLDVPDPEQRITQVINCNILSVTQMTRLVLPHMAERHKGLIINVSSEAASAPQPLLSLYSATKIFVTYFSRCLNSEYRSQGITVQCVTPFIVSTNMTYNIEVGAFVKSAPAYAHEALNTVGYSSFTSGCILHALQHSALSVFFPEWFRLSSFSVRQMERFARSHQQQIEAMIQESQKKQN